MSKKKPSKPALVNRQVFKDQLKQTPVAERQRILKQFFESAGCTLPGYSLKRAHLMPLPIIYQQIDRSPEFEAALQELYYKEVKADVSGAILTDPKETDSTGQTTETETRKQEEDVDETTLQGKIEVLQQQLAALQQEFQAYKKQSKEAKQEFRIQLDNEQGEKRNLEKQVRRLEAEKEELRSDFEKELAVREEKVREAMDKVKAAEDEKQELQKRLELLKKYEEKQLREKSKLPKILIFSRVDISEEAEDLNCDLRSDLTGLEKLPWKEYEEIWNVSGTMSYADKLKLKSYTSLKVLSIGNLKNAIEEMKRK